MWKISDLKTLTSQHQPAHSHCECVLWMHYECSFIMTADQVVNLQTIDPYLLIYLQFNIMVCSITPSGMRYAPYCWATALVVQTILRVKILGKNRVDFVFKGDLKR